MADKEEMTLFQKWQMLMSFKKNFHLLLSFIIVYNVCLASANPLSGSYSHSSASDGTTDLWEIACSAAPVPMVTSNVFILDGRRAKSQGIKNQNNTLRKEKHTFNKLAHSRVTPCDYTG